MPEPYSLARFDALTSTNDYCLEHLGGLADRTVVLAEVQSDGHGRFERRWISHIPDNIYISIVLKSGLFLEPSCPLAAITQYMALTVCRLLQECGADAALKWPNDVLVEGRKICGLLSRTSISNGRLAGYILGAGINLNMEADAVGAIDQPATALNLVIGRPVDRDLFLSRLLDRFFEGYAAFLRKGFPSIKEQYTAQSPFLGRTITVNLPDGPVQGKAAGFDDEGRLRLVTPDGDIRILMVGDVTVPND